MPDRSNCTVEVAQESLLDPMVWSASTARYDHADRLVYQADEDPNGVWRTLEVSYDAAGCMISAWWTLNGVRHGADHTCDEQNNPVTTDGLLAEGMPITSETSYVYDGSLVMELEERSTTDLWTSERREVNTYEDGLATRLERYLDGVLTDVLTWTWADGLLMSEAVENRSGGTSSTATFSYDEAGRMAGHEILFDDQEYALTYSWLWMADRYHVEEEELEVAGNESGDGAHRLTWSCSGEFPWMCEGLYEDREGSEPGQFTLAYAEAWTCDD